MDQLSAILIGKVLDGLSTRQTVISQNIANANSQSYQPQKVSFEAELRVAAKQGVEAVRNVEARIETVGGKFTNGEMRLDLEMAAASGTAGRYAALIEILNRQMQVKQIAVRGGQ